MRVAIVAVIVGLSLTGLGATPFRRAAYAAPPELVAQATVTYGAGWNLISGPEGMQFSQCSNPLYTFQAGDSRYEVLPNAAGVVSGRGYWCYMSRPTTLSLQGNSASSRSVAAPAGQFIMIGNPSATDSLTVTGANLVYAWQPASNAYAVTTTVAPGQGAWAISIGGGTITVGGGNTVSATVPRPPSNVRATVLSSSSIRLDWSGDSGGVDGYQIYDTATNSLVKSVDGSTTSFTLVGLAPDSEYCAAVYAYNSAGRSPSSSRVCATTAAR